MESTTHFFAQKKFPKDFLNLLLMRLISNWTSCRTIQGVIVLVISNRSRAASSSDFEFTGPINP